MTCSTAAGSGSHPCAGHSCDHCYTCDVVGICCGSTRANGSQAVVKTDLDVLREAIQQDLQATEALSVLVATDLSVEAIRPALVSHSESTSSVHTDSSFLRRSATAALPPGTPPDLTITNHTNREEQHHDSNRSRRK